VLTAPNGGRENSMSIWTNKGGNETAKVSDFKWAQLLRNGKPYCMRIVSCVNYSVTMEDVIKQYPKECTILRFQGDFLVFPSEHDYLTWCNDEK